MPRPGITKLSLPPLAYRPDLIMEDFETAKAARDQDELRAHLLRSTKHSGRFGNEAKALADRLHPGIRGRPTETPASAVYMRDQRIRIGGHLHQLVDGEDPEDVSTFTAVKRAWATYAGDLADVDAWHLREVFRLDLQRCGSNGATGWLFAALDCEFDPPTNNYQFHVHGVAARGMVDVVERLRKRPGFEPWEGIPGVPDGKRPIVRSRAPLTDLPRPLAYLVKHYWKVKIGKQTRRLPGDEHSRALLFVDRYRLEQLTLLVNMTVAVGEFRVG